ncbi:MAG: hypothetical protein KIT84_44505 [Labilithrix sp.]|nr:hypothetical protein [Labilithrix sp.]MCW5818142.1 hypothetical protein [Labilithrix sp.]
MSTGRDASATESTTPLLAVLVLGIMAGVLQRTNGMYRSFAVVLVAIAWVLALVALLGRVRVPRADVWLPRLVTLTLGTFVVLLLTNVPTDDILPEWRPGLVPFYAGVVVALIGCGALALGPARFERLLFPALVGLYFVLGAVVIHVAKKPSIDVWSIEMEAVPALLRGENPFAMTFVDPYAGTSPYFPEGTSVGGRLQFGFVYPPLALLLCVPGYVLGGDTRWSTLAAIAISALFIGYAREGRLPKLAALLLLFMPRSFFVMDRAWTDPFVVMLTAAVSFFALRRPRWVFVPIGLYVCLKQHMFIGVPALFLLLPRPIRWRDTAVLTAKAAGVAALVTLPLALWDFHAFAKSVLDIREMFRVDSLGLVAFLHNHGIVTLSKWAGLVAIVPVMLLGSLRAPRTPGGFALMAGVTHFSLYIWSTHAFCNEYYNVFGALCCAVGAWGRYDGLES